MLACKVIGSVHDDEGLTMKIDYDPEANAAYITLGAPVQKGQAAFQSDIITTPLRRGHIILDFDRDGRLLGLEVLSARDVVSPELLPRDH